MTLSADGLQEVEFNVTGWTLVQHGEGELPLSVQHLRTQQGWPWTSRRKARPIRHPVAQDTQCDSLSQRPSRRRQEQPKSLFKSKQDTQEGHGHVAAGREVRRRKCFVLKTRLHVWS